MLVLVKQGTLFPAGLSGDGSLELTQLGEPDWENPFRTSYVEHPQAGAKVPSFWDMHECLPEGHGKAVGRY